MSFDRYNPAGGAEARDEDQQKHHCAQRRLRAAEDQLPLFRRQQAAAREPEAQPEAAEPGRGDQAGHAQQGHGVADLLAVARAAQRVPRDLHARAQQLPDVANHRRTSAISA
jgi:hypothetical protein